MEKSFPSFDHFSLHMLVGKVANILILGHSFVKRLQHDMLFNFDARVDANFKLQGSALVHLHGIDGRTVAKLRTFR